MRERLCFGWIVRSRRLLEERRGLLTAYFEATSLQGLDVLCPRYNDCLRLLRDVYAEAR